MNITKRKSSNSGSAAGQTPSSAPKVDFSKVALSSLRKYKKAHRVRTKNNSATASKAELAEAVTKHFAQLPPPEDEAAIIESFALAVKNQEREKKKRPRSPQK